MSDIYHTPREVFGVNVYDNCVPASTFIPELAEWMHEPELGNPPFVLRGGVR